MKEYTWILTTHLTDWIHFVIYHYSIFLRMLSTIFRYFGTSLLLI